MSLALLASSEVPALRIAVLAVVMRMHPGEPCLEQPPVVASTFPEALAVFVTESFHSPSSVTGVHSSYLQAQRMLSNCLPVSHSSPSSVASLQTGVQLHK
jgi:hypothetical protein